MIQSGTNLQVFLEILNFVFLTGFYQTDRAGSASLSVPVPVVALGTD